MIALFGEAERGEYSKAYLCQDLPDLLDFLGNPPPDSRGLYYATQSLLYHHPLVYFRVAEEGFSLEDYIHGIDLLIHPPLLGSVSAICSPGIGDKRLLEAFFSLCNQHQQLFIIDERDFFDYLSS